MKASYARSPLERSALGYGLIGISCLGVVVIVRAFAVGDAASAIPTLVLWGVMIFGWTTGRLGIVPLAWLCIGVAAVAGTLLDDPINRASAYIGMVALASVLATFARRHVKRVVLAVSVVAALAPLVWEGSAVLSAVIASSCLISGLLVAGLRDAIGSALDRSQRVLEYAPVPIMEQDWSGVVRAMSDLRRSGVTDLGTYFHAHPAEVARLIDQVQLLFANQATLDFYQAPSKQAVFQRFNAAGDDRLVGAVNERSYEEYRALLVDMWNGVIPQDAEIPSYALNGDEVWGRVRSYGDPDNPAARIVALADITQLKRTQAELEESNRSKDRFVASVSHELRTPLSAVVGFASELVDDAASFSKDDQHELFQTIRDEAQEVADIIEDLLVVARADIGGIAVVHRRIDVLDEIERLLRGVGGGFELQKPSRSPLACGDAVRVRQIIRNLITNAVRYGGQHRRIRVQSDGSSVTVDVTDDGTSLDPADLSRVFEAYTRAHASMGTTESVGLGLTVSKILAQLMNGSLAAHRADGETVFRLSLPRWGTCPASGEGAVENGISRGAYS